MSEESTRQHLPWARIAAESVAIIASILLAFSIDALWESNSLARQEQQILADLSDEFEQNEALVLESLGYHVQFYDSAIRLLGTIDEGETNGALTPAAADTLITQVFLGVTTLHPAAGVLDGLLASGDLDLIANRRLRGRLGSWPRIVEEFAEEERLILSLVNDVLTPFVAERVPLRSLSYYLTLPAVAVGDRRVSIPSTSRTVPYDELFGSLEFENLVTRRAEIEAIALRDGRALSEAVKDILSLVRNGLQSH